jgi:hypothetical protein
MSSDGVECFEIAVTNMGNRHYCARHYDIWIEYYRKHLFDCDCVIVDEGIEDVKQVLKNR